MCTLFCFMKTITTYYKPLCCVHHVYHLCFGACVIDIQLIFVRVCILQVQYPQTSDKRNLIHQPLLKEARWSYICWICWPNQTFYVLAHLHFSIVINEKVRKTFTSYILLDSWLISWYVWNFKLSILELQGSMPGGTLKSIFFVFLVYFNCIPKTYSKCS